MAGYARQSASTIQPNEVIKAAPVNAEYNAIRDAFALSGGHKHDGSSTEGAYVPLIADTDALNKVAVDTSNNRHGVFVEVSSSAVEQIRFQDGVVVPVTDNDIDLGTVSLQFKDVYVNGTTFTDALGFGTVSMTLPTADGNANQILITDGSGALSFTDNSGGTSWQGVKTANYTASAGEGIFANTTSSAFTVTLPASPSIGDEVSIKDYAGTFDTNNLTVGRNSQPIEGVAADLTVSVERAGFTLAYSDGTQGWLLKDK